VCDYLYVSADLRWFVSLTTERLAADFTQGDADHHRAYRRLNAVWFSWLALSHAGKHPQWPAFRAVCVARIGEKSVRAAEYQIIPHDYQPPQVCW
jgi:hypothetical protein